MAPKYTLHYFQVPARGEFIRIIFNHAGVEFQDLTFPAKEISKIKDDDTLYPLGQLPVLVLENGEVIAQSHAIVRFLASEFDLYGKSSHDKVIIDQTLDTLKNVEENLRGAYFWTKEPEAKEQKLKNTFEDTIPRALKMIENFLKKNNNGESFLVGDSITIADIHILVAVETMLLPENENYRDILDTFPLIKCLNERVRSSPRIKEYLDKRGPPVYNFGF